MKNMFENDSKSYCILWLTQLGRGKNIIKRTVIFILLKINIMKYKMYSIYIYTSQWGKTNRPTTYTGYKKKSKFIIILRIS